MKNATTTTSNVKGLKIMKLSDQAKFYKNKAEKNEAALNEILAYVQSEKFSVDTNVNAADIILRIQESKSEILKTENDCLNEEKEISKTELSLPQQKLLVRVSLDYVTTWEGRKMRRDVYDRSATYTDLSGSAQFRVAYKLQELGLAETLSVCPHNGNLLMLTKKGVAELENISDEVKKEAEIEKHHSITRNGF